MNPFKHPFEEGNENAPFPGGRGVIRESWAENQKMVLEPVRYERESREHRQSMEEGRLGSRPYRPSY